MPVGSFTEGLEPADREAVIWRFMDFAKFENLLVSGQLYFRRSDKLNDDHEGLPPEEFARKSLGLDRYDIGDNHELDNTLGTSARFRQAFYLSCWYLFKEETANMWARYGSGGVAIVSRYSRLSAVLDATPDRTYLGLVRYGWKLGTRWNLHRFITTKREEYSHEQEVRAALWLLNTGDGVNRHIDIDNRVHRRPVYSPPSTMPLGITRAVDLRTLVAEVVLNPNADAQFGKAVASLVSHHLPRVAVRASALTAYAHLLPSADDLRDVGFDRTPQAPRDEPELPSLPEAGVDPPTTVSSG